VRVQNSKMKYYIDIKLLPDAEISLGFLWKKVYQQVHLSLVEAKNESLALSFPQYGAKIFPMGDILRMFAPSKQEMESLDLDNWLSRLKDYIEISKILQTPDNVSYIHFKRRQFKYHNNVLKRAEHQAKRRGISLEEALEHFKDYKAKENTLPFIQVKSLSSNQELKIFIEKVEKDEELEGNFNTFGLSKTATVPYF